MQKITFVLERETKNTYRFTEVDSNGHPIDPDACLIGTVYIKKRAFEGKPSHVELVLKTI